MLKSCERVVRSKAAKDVVPVLHCLPQESRVWLSISPDSRLGYLSCLTAQVPWAQENPTAHSPSISGLCQQTPHFNIIQAMYCPRWLGKAGTAKKRAWYRPRGSKHTWQKGKPKPKGWQVSYKQRIFHTSHGDSWCYVFVGMPKGISRFVTKPWVNLKPGNGILWTLHG